MSKRKAVNSNSRAQSSANEPQSDQAQMNENNPKLRASTKAQTELSKALQASAASSRRGKQNADETGGEPNSNQAKTRSGAKSKSGVEEEKMRASTRGGRQISVSQERGRRTNLKSGGNQYKRRASEDVDDNEDEQSEVESENEQEYLPDSRKNKSAVSNKRRGGKRGSRADSSNSQAGITKHTADQKRLIRGQGKQAKNQAQSDLEEKKRALQTTIPSALASNHQDNDRSSDVEEIEDEQKRKQYDQQVDDELDQLEEEERFLRSFNNQQATRSPQATPSFTSHLPSTQKNQEPSQPFNGVELIDLVSPYKPSLPEGQVPGESKQSARFQRLLTQGSKKPHPLHDSYLDTSLSQQAPKKSSVLPPVSDRSSNSSRKRKFDEISNGEPEGISLDDNIVGSQQTLPTPAKNKDVDMNDASQPNNELLALQENKRKKMNQAGGNKSQLEESKDGEQSYIDLQNLSGVKGQNSKAFDSSQADRLFNQDRQQTQAPPSSKGENFEFTVEPFDDEKMEGVASFSQNHQANKQNKSSSIANPFLITRQENNNSNDTNNNNFTNLRESQDGSVRSPSFSQSGLISSNKMNDKNINGDRQNYLNGDQLIANAQNSNASGIEIEEEKFVIDTNVAINELDYFHNLVMQDPQFPGIQPSEYKILSKNINKEKAIFDYDTFEAEQLNNVQQAVLDHQRKIIYCNQKLFQRNQPDGSSKLMWVILDLHNGFDCGYNLTSPTFTLADGSCFQLTYLPAIKDRNSFEIYSQLILEGVPTKENKPLECRFNVSYSSFTKTDGGIISQKAWQLTNQFLNGPDDKNILNKFICLANKQDIRAKLNLDRIFCIGITMEPLIYVNAKEEEDKQQQQQQIQQSQTTQTKINRRIRSKLRDHAYNGLVNEGTTCYLNSLIQTLFIIRTFRRAVYHMPTKMDDFKSIPYCLQRIFYNLQTGKNPVRTYELLNAFGWSAEEMNQQHDVNEFFLVLSDTLETQMNNTPVSGTYAQLFEGEVENVVKCKNVNFESIRREKFNCLQLSMTNATSVEEAIENYCKAEELVGVNQYDAGAFGKQDAYKFIRFKKLPPVLQVQINRFSYDMQLDQMTKINLKLKFQEILDLDCVLNNGRVASQNLYSQPNSRGQLSQNNGVRNLYHLHAILIHRGGLGAGHYFAFIRPSLEDRWFEFNDSVVDPILRSTALAIGSGGPASFFEYDKDERAIFERERPTNTSGYMLVYVRDADRPEIMREIEIEDIPRQLKVKFDEENKLNEQIYEDFNDQEDCSTAYITSYETIKDWKSIDIMQALGDFYKDKNFSDNERQRFKIKLPKKATVEQLLNIIQLNTRIPIQDLILYRIKKRSGQHFLAQIVEEDLKKPVFMPKIKTIFFVSSLSKPMGRPILKQFTASEKSERVLHFKRVIDFVKRRGLSSDYVNFYRDQFSQVFRFSEQNILKIKTEESDEEEESDLEEVKSRLDMSSNLQTVMQSPLLQKDDKQRVSEAFREGENVVTVQKQQDVAMSCEEDEEERTLEIKQTVDLKGINNQRGSNQMAVNAQRLQKQDAKILFIKTFENSDAKNQRLKIVGQLILHRDLSLRNLMEKMLLEKQLLPLLEDPQVLGVEKQYDLILENFGIQNFQPKLNQPMTMERERSLQRFKDIIDQNDKSLFYARMNLREADLDELLLDSFVDGSTFILLPVNPPVPALRDAYPEDGSYLEATLKTLNAFMQSEDNTLWLKLLEVTEDNPHGNDLGKHYFSNQWTAIEIMDEIRAILMREEYGGRQIQDGYLQLQFGGALEDAEEKWVQMNELNFSLSNFMDSFSITFRVNKFHIDELFDQVQAKVTIFKQNNLKGVNLIKLMPTKSAIGYLRQIIFLNEVLPRYANQRFPGFSEEEEKKHWQLFVMHKENSILVRHPQLKESVAEIMKECAKKNQTLRMQYLLDEDLEISNGQNSSPVLVCCQVFDQYNSRIGNSIIMFVENWFTLDQIQDLVRNRVKLYKIQHPIRRNYSNQTKEKAALEFEDEESTYNSEQHQSKDYVMHLQEPCIDEAKLMYLEFGTQGRRQVDYSQLIPKEIDENYMNYSLLELNSRAYIRYFGLSVDVIYEDDDRQRIANGGGGRGLRIKAQSSLQSPSNPYESDDQANGDQNQFDPTQQV